MPTPADDPENAAALAALAALRAEYRAALPGKIADLARALAAAREPGASAAMVGAARMLAHRLRGTAGSYGLHAVGDAAGRLEDAILALIDAPEGGRDGAWREVDRAFAGVSAEADLAARGPRPELRGCDNL